MGEPNGPNTVAYCSKQQCNGVVSLLFSVAPVSSSPALVLDDSCVVERDLSCHVMGR
ncbi:hypothetical protein Tco_0333733, partial [Tanacetum coccineum]